VTEHPGVNQKRSLFLQRVTVLQREYSIPWEDAVAIAQELNRLVREFEQREFFKRGTSGEITR